MITKKGDIDIKIQVYEMTPTLRLIEIKKVEGDDSAYLEVYAKLKKLFEITSNKLVDEGLVSPPVRTPTRTTNNILFVKGSDSRESSPLTTSRTIPKTKPDSRNNSPLSGSPFFRNSSPASPSSNSSIGTNPSPLILSPNSGRSKSPDKPSLSLLSPSSGRSKSPDKPSSSYRSKSPDQLGDLTVKKKKISRFLSLGKNKDKDKYKESE